MGARICGDSVLPSLNTVLHLAALEDNVVIPNDHGLFTYAKREAFHKFDEPVGVYVIFSGETMVNAISVNHSEDVGSAAFIYRHTEVLIFEFPRIRHRIRNEWVELFRYPFYRAVRCSSLIFIFVACLDITGEISMCKIITFENGFQCINSLLKHT